ncbi:P-loop containing nucleoside triphosphate hydrolase protein [Pisolithus marmoratus]|nr:P-loop containing nucleoside triphosphate hydrolase protein [Pisolithus marmoratus]
MLSFGIPREDIAELFGSFLDDIHDGMLSNEQRLADLDFGRFTLTPEETSSGQRVDQVISQLFFAWASHPTTQATLRKRVPASTLNVISRLYRIADLSFPADLYPVARSMRRKIIMHVGPTNSGKTHMALRALAAAKSGLYAGPLRLLAHEIWERLNKGQIVPLGMSPEGEAEPDTAINTDIVEETGTKPTLRKQGNNKYIRSCNLRTGEEFRVVSDSASLLSCTVEMAALDTQLDVAVVDEIQMIADPARGSAWTMAILGIAARELHLCGEEAAVPVVEEILKHTGDELVNRYQRLTPLVVQDESLHGDLSHIQKGDCVVTFSRSNIFALKKRVEECTGLLCAVAYGKLPPEIRSEQAALFNDPNSGYDVIVASDAIGMGLNLKIKRVVFEVLNKFDGYVERALSVSQIKQIAGRAGRYGLHGEPGGFVTTLYPEDLPRLKSALSTPPEALPYAIIDPSESWMEDVAQILHPKSSIQALFEVPSYVSKVQSPFRAALPSKLEDMVKFIDTRARDMLLADKLMLKNCPTSWREAGALDILTQITRLYKREVQVDLDAVLAVAPLMDTLERVEKRMNRGVVPAPRELQSALRTLEDMHKTLVLYLWLGFRNYMAFHQADEAHALKGRVEKALDWCLRQVSGQHNDEALDQARQERPAGELEYHQKRRSKETRDAEVRKGVAFAEVVAAARRASTRDG